MAFPLSIYVATMFSGSTGMLALRMLSAPLLASSRGSYGAVAAHEIAIS